MVDHDRSFKDKKELLYRFSDPPFSYRAVFLGDQFKSCASIVSSLGRKLGPIKTETLDSIDIDAPALFVQEYEMKCDVTFGEDARDAIKFSLWDFEV